MSCAACGYQGPPPAESAHSLRTAAQIVFQSDVRSRQFSAALRSKLASADRRRQRYLLVFILVALPITLFSMVMALGIAVDDDTEGNLFMGSLIALAWIATVGSGALGLALVLRRQRQLVEACAARPPQAPGEPAACHICGAPLAGGVEGVVRCTFCGADNLVDPRVLARLRHRQSVAQYAIEQEVGAELRSFEHVTTQTSAALAATALAIPIGTTVLLLILLFALNARREPVDAKIRYVAVSTPVGRCIGKLVSKRGKGAVVSFGAWRPDKLPKEQPFDAAAGQEPFSAETLIGRTLETPSGKVGRVEVVFSSPLTGNSAGLRRADGVMTDTSIAGLCFKDEPDKGASTPARGSGELR